MAQKADAAMFDPQDGMMSLTDAPVFVDAPDEPRYDEDIFHLFNATAAAERTCWLPLGLHRHSGKAACPI